MFELFVLIKTLFRLRGTTTKEQSFRKQLYFGLALTFVPPAVVAALYLYASSTGCSGGECAGAMLLVGLLGLAAVATTLTGAIWLLIILVNQLFKNVGRPKAY